MDQIYNFFPSLKKYFLSGLSFFFIVIFPIFYIWYFFLTKYTENKIISDIIEEIHSGFTNWPLIIFLSLFLGILLYLGKAYNFFTRRILMLTIEDMHRLMLESFRLKYSNPDNSEVNKEKLKDRNRNWANILHEVFIQLYYPNIYSCIESSRLKANLRSSILFSCFISIFLLVLSILIQFSIVKLSKNCTMPLVLWLFFGLLIFINIGIIIRGKSKTNIAYFEANNITQSGFFDAFLREYKRDKCKLFLRLMEEITKNSDESHRFDSERHFDSKSAEETIE